MELVRTGPAVVHRVVFPDGHDVYFGYYTPPLVGARFGAYIGMVSVDAVAESLAVVGEEYVFLAEEENDSGEGRLSPRTYVPLTDDERVVFEAVYTVNKD